MATPITMPDIARLAHVSRQAVTNWRSRPASLPFPEPVDATDPILKFDRDEIIDWLEATGRGNNLESRLDAPAIAVPDDLDLESAVIAMTLRSQVAEDLGSLTSSERVALAEVLDPRDAYLLAEVRDVADRDDLFDFVDGLVSATFGGTDALEHLYNARVVRGIRGLAPELVELMRSVANAARGFLGPDDTSVAIHLDPRDRAVGSDFSATSTSEVDRSVLRHLALEGLPFDDELPHQVLVFSTVGATNMETLDAVDEVTLGLGPGQVAIVVGPASALCDRLTGDLYDVRRRTLELGANNGAALVAAFKLPRGLWLAAHRASLGMWVLSGSSEGKGVVVADLSGRIVDRTGLSDDVMGALEQTGARAYQYGRSVRYAEVWTRDTVVLPGIGSVEAASPNSASTHDTVVQESLLTRENIAGLDITAAAGDGPTRLAPRSLGELIDRRTIRASNGCRISTESLDPAGTIPVLAATTSTPIGYLDSLTAAARYTHAVRTEPGDVVFTSSPPRAIVDEAGGSRVASPSRILRVLDAKSAGIGPRALTSAINSMVEGTEWRTWRIPTIPQDEIAALEATLGEALVHLETLRRREVTTNSLITHLIQGVAEGSVALRPPTTERKAG